MSPANRSDGQRATFTITKDEVRRTFDAFVAALTTGDYQTLHDLYDNGYLLIRPDGTVLGKKDILNDLTEHSMVLSGFETTPISLKTTGTVGILTTATRSTFIRDGFRQGTTHELQTVVFVKTDCTVTITHFQSTMLVATNPATPQCPEWKEDKWQELLMRLSTGCKG